MSIRPPSTSTSIAAHKASRGLAEALREQILGQIQESGSSGLIWEDIRATFPETVKDSSINARFSELERKGLIVRNGDTRPGASGRQQLVMRSAEFGVAMERKVHKTAFLAGLMYGAKIVAAAKSLEEAKAKMRSALLTTAKRST